MTENVFEFLGLLFLFILSFKVFRSLCRGIYQCYIGPMIGMTVNFKELGQWAVVTGATDGIGKAYAEELARRGLSVVLISRTLEKLKTVAEELEKKFSVKTKVIAVDFTGGPEIYDDIARELGGLEIGVLVNNVGVSYVYPEYLSSIPDGEKIIEDILNANCLACTKMTRMVIGEMEKRRKGVIINVSSLSGLMPTALLSIYSASKAYMDYLSRSLQVEYRDKGVIVQSVLPAYVISNMSKLRRPSWNIPMPRDYVRWTISTVGIEDRTYGYPPHKLMGYFIEMMMLYLPTALLDTVTSNNNKGVRRAYFRKHGITSAQQQGGAKDKNH